MPHAASLPQAGRAAAGLVPMGLMAPWAQGPPMGPLGPNESSWSDMASHAYIYIYIYIYIYYIIYTYIHNNFGAPFVTLNK